MDPPPVRCSTDMRLRVMPPVGEGLAICVCMACIVWHCNSSSGVYRWRVLAIASTMQCRTKCQLPWCGMPATECSTWSGCDHTRSTHNTDMHTV